VDPIAAHGLLTLIMDLVKQERLAVLISSHRLEEIEALQSKALLLDRGRVKYSGDLDSLRREWERPEVEFTLDTPAAAHEVAENLLAQGLDVTVDGSDVRFRTRGTEPVGAVLSRLGGLTAGIRHVRETPMPLRDLIAQVYQQGENR
jgi:ABC-2 type transport system ATP-binding protein